MYADRQSLEARIGNETLNILADDNGDGVAEEGVIDEVLTQASFRIDASLGTRYAVPVESPPPVLEFLCVSLAAPLLFARKREPVPEEHSGLHQSALDFLSSVERGEIALFGLSPRSLFRSTSQHRDKIFSDDALKNF